MRKKQTQFCIKHKRIECVECYISGDHDELYIKIVKEINRKDDHGFFEYGLADRLTWAQDVIEKAFDNREIIPIDNSKSELSQLICSYVNELADPDEPKNVDSLGIYVLVMAILEVPK